MFDRPIIRLADQRPRRLLPIRPPPQGRLGPVRPLRHAEFRVGRAGSPNRVRDRVGLARDGPALHRRAVPAPASGGEELRRGRGRRGGGGNDAVGGEGDCVAAQEHDVARGEAGEVGGGSGDAWREGECGSDGGEPAHGDEEAREELLGAVGTVVGACSDGGESRVSDLGEG